MQFLFWIIDGLVASWLIGKMMSDQGRDLLRDIMMGVVGGVAGGLIVNVAGLPVRGKMIYTNLAATLGTIFLTSLSRRIAAGNRRYA